MAPHGRLRRQIRSRLVLVVAATVSVAALYLLLLLLSSGGPLPAAKLAAQAPAPADPSTVFLPILSARQAAGCQPPTAGTPGLVYDESYTEGAIVEVFGDRAYVLTWMAGEYSRLAVYDLSAAGAGRLIGRTDVFQGFAVDVQVHGDFAYVPVVDDSLSSAAIEVLVIDLREPSLPLEGARFEIAAETPHLAGIVVWGGRLYAAAAAEGLKVFDLTDPAHPRQVGGHPDTVVGVMPWQGRLLVWHDRTPLEFAPEIELRLMSLDDPDNPTPLGRGLRLPGHPSAMVPAGSSVFLSLYGGEVLRFQLDGSARLEEAGAFSVTGRVFDLAWEADRLAVVVAPDGEDNSVALFDTRGGDPPRHLSSIVPDSEAYDVSWAGDRLLIGASDGLHAYDAADPAAPTASFGPERTRAWGRSVVVDGATAYVADVYRGLVSVDLSNPSRPRELSAGGEPAEALAVRDGLAFLVGARSWEAILGIEGGASLQVFDLTDPASPQRIAHLPEAWDIAFGVVAHGDELFVNTRFDRDPLKRVDVSDPRAPRVVEPLPVEGSVLGLAADGRRLAASTDAGELLIWDLDGATMPIPSERLPIFGGRIAIDGARLAVGNDFFGIDVHRWNEKPERGPTSSYGPLYDVFALAIDGQHLATADAAGLRILKLDAPRCARETALLPMPAAVTDLAFAGDRLIVLHGDGLVVVRIEPDRPVEIIGRLHWAG